MTFNLVTILDIWRLRMIMPFGNYRLHIVCHKIQGIMEHNFGRQLLKNVFVGVGFRKNDNRKLNSNETFAHASK